MVLWATQTMLSNQLDRHLHTGRKAVAPSTHYIGGYSMGHSTAQVAGRPSASVVRTTATTCTNAHDAGDGVCSLKLYYLSAPTPAPPRIGWHGPMRATTSFRSTAANAGNLVPVACTSCGRSPTAMAHALRAAQFWHLIGSRISYLISSRLGICLRQSSLTCLGLPLRGAVISICRSGTGTRHGLRRTLYWQVSLLRLGLR